MSGFWKAVVVLGLGAAIVAPLLTLHAGIAHVLGITTLSIPPSDLGLAWLLALSVISMVPVVLMCVRLPAMVRSVRLISTLSASGERRRVKGFEVIVLPAAELMIFTAGLRRPHTFVSQGVLAALDDEQLEAALLHESAHISAHDTSWRTALLMVARAYVFVPRLRDAVEALHTDAELRADGQAVAHGASPLALFEALVRVAAPSPTGEQVAIARFSDRALESRLQNLAKSGGPVSPPRPWLIGASVAGVAALPLAAHALLAYEIICHGVMG